MAQAHRSSSSLKFAAARLTCFVFFRIIFVSLFQVARANKQAFIQTDTILEVFHFGDEGLLQTESDINSYHQKSSPLQRGNGRPIRFEPPMLDFHEQPVGMPKMEKVYLHNPSTEDISLISISATTAHFHASFFQNRIIQSGGNTSFDVVFLARVVGNVENTLFINTSDHGMFTYQVFGVGIPNPYRLRPFIGARVPVNSSFSPLINIHNPHSEPLQVVEMYSSGGDLHLELPTGQQGGRTNLWEIPPFETKGVMRASFSSREADNHTAFIRIKTNASDPDHVIILPVEVEVTSAPGIYSSIEMLDFGTLRTQDKPKQLNLHLLNSGTKDVQITSVRASPPNDAVMIDFRAITLKAGENKYTKVASISFDASKVQKSSQSLGKITVKAKEKSYSKLEIPYQAEVLDGYLGFDHTVTLFHIRDSVTEPLVKPIHLTNTFHFAIRIHDVALPEDARIMFKVLNFSQPVVIPPQGSRYIFSLEFRPLRPSRHIDDNILLVTNASRFHLPIRAYSGTLEPLVLPPSSSERFLDFGVLGAADTSSILFVVFNSNPIELVLRPWQVTGESVKVELLRTERGNQSTVLHRARELHNASASTHTTVAVAPGYYAAFRVTLSAMDLEGPYEAAVHITTDYEILTIPVRAVIAVGTLTGHPKHMVLPPAFPGKVVHQSFSIISSFSQRVRLLHIQSLTSDKRFFYRRLKTSRDELEPKRKSKMAKIYFDASLSCGDYCYVGVPFVLKSESRPPGLFMQEDMWDADVDLYQMLSERWRELKENSQHTAEAVFEATAELHKTVQTRVTAQLKWPSILNSSRQVLFPLTSVNSSSEMEVVLENPADVPIYVQILPLALYPNLSAVTEKLAQMFPLERLPHFSPSTLEFQVYRNQSIPQRSRQGFVEGATQPHVYNLPLQPEELKTLRVQFSPSSNHTVTSLLILRNNLTGVEFLIVQGRGCYEQLRVGGKYPGSGGFLRFKMVESHLKECTDINKPREPSFTLRRAFKMENTGQLPIDIESIEINGRPCEGFGFKVQNCQKFALQPNASKDVVILFTPDFTASRVIRELKMTSAGGSQFLFSLNASLPYHLLASCSTALPRPNWELKLYVVVCVFMSSMFLLVVVAAYLEAVGIWEMFRKRVCFETSGSSMETGKPFDLREIVRLQSSSIQTGKGNARGSQGRSLPQTAAPNTQVGPKASDTGRKVRGAGARQSQQNPGSSGSQQGTSGPGQGQVTAAAHEEQEYEHLVEAMDKDLDRPEHVPEDLESAPSSQGKVTKGKVQRKTKTQKRVEENEGKTKGKAQSEEPPPQEDNDDSSSTTTETSNTDTEPNLREEAGGRKPKRAENESQDVQGQSSKPKSKKLPTPKEKSQMTSSLELPYVTPLENKRKAFSSKSAINQAPATAAPVPAKVLPSKPRVSRGKLEDLRHSPLAKFLPSGSSSGSEGESNVSPPPEWDSVPLYKTGSAVDSLQQISMHTIIADPYLKRPTATPPPTSASFSTCSPHSPLGFPSSEAGSKAALGTKTKLIKSASLPGQNGNPTFAAVAAGYDKSPGGSSSCRGAVSRSGPAHMGSVDSDCSESPSPVSPIGNGRSPILSNTFSAFGSSNIFNLSGVFSGITSGRNPEPEKNWPEFSPITPPTTGHMTPTSYSPATSNSYGPSPSNSYGPSPSNSYGSVPSTSFGPSPSTSYGPAPPGSVWPTETFEPWPCTSSSTVKPSTSILGSSSVWSSSPPFSPSIWSNSADSAPLHPFPPPSTSPLVHLMGSSDSGGPPPAPIGSAPGELSPTYNPWSMWRPTLRRSSEPWPSPDH